MIDVGLIILALYRKKIGEIEMSIEAYGNVLGLITPEDRIKHNEDGTVDIITTSLSNKKLSSSNIVLRIKEDMFKQKLESRIKQSVKVNIRGKMKACVSKKGIPYVLIYVEEVKKIKNKKAILDELEKQKEQEKIIPWYEKLNENDFEDVDIDKIKLVEDIHLNKPFMVRINIDKENPIAIKLNEVGEYVLVVGVSAYINAKVKGEKTIKSYKTDLSRSEFIEKFKMGESN